MLKHELSEYQQELADKICSIVATHTESLEDLVKMYELPPVRTIYDWLYRNDAFSRNYAKAKQIQASRMIEELDKIAKEKSYYIDAEGNERVDPGYTASQRLIADTRKFIASKLVPKVYGDKQTIEQTVTVKHEDALKDLE
jgi:uncharacterized protein (DUF2461 family)